MGILETSSLQDVVTALGTDNPVMTVRITKDPAGNEQIDVVTKQGMESAAAQGGAHLEVSGKQKLALDIPAETIAGLEQALENSPVGNTAQTAAFEQLLQQPLAVSAPAVPTASTDQAIVIQPIDAEKAIYSVQLNPELVNQKVLDQLDALAASEAFGPQSLQVVGKIKEAIAPLRPDLASLQQAASLQGNAAQFDAQGEGTKIVPTSASSKISENRSDAQMEGMAPIASAQESYMNEGSFARANASGSARTDSQTEVNPRLVHNPSSHGRIVEAEAMVQR